MISKKICMIGAFCVGKTALVQRFVYSLFSDRYLSTLGVKISKKVMQIEEQEVNLVLWDLEGKDDYAGVNFSYLRGAMGFFVVADGTRLETLEAALNLRARSLELIGSVPNILLVNKADLAEEWEVTEAHLEEIRKQGITVLCTSAKTGESVDEAFYALTAAMLEGV
jgi:small GTP-binding protein domain